jgi:hypothetical protein
MMAVEPTDRAVTPFPEMGAEADPGDGGVSLDLDIVDQAIKNLPKAHHGLQYALMTRSDSRVELTATDMKTEKRIAGIPRRHKFPDWKSLFRKAAVKTRKARICLDRNMLADLLRTIDAACGGKGSDPEVYLEVGDQLDSVILRAENRSTGQRIVAALAPLNNRGQWMVANRWERDVLGRQIKEKRG